jgi:anhydro-N-acetylmuramic acid kinase
MKNKSIQSRDNSDLLSLFDNDASIDIVGLNSGTSGDGLDAAIVRFAPNERPQMLLAKTFLYPWNLRERIIAAGEHDFADGIQWLKLDTELGILTGRLIKRFISKANVIKANPKLIASHGQTVRHLPSIDKNVLTLQIGEPAYIAKATGLPVISDFRRSDLAAGGEGAPLSPVLHQELFSHHSKWRAIVNIGGVANITILPPPKSRDHPLAGDCGPGNMLIDMAMKRLFSKAFDHNGQTALKGNADERIVSQIMNHSFFDKRPPKSTGRELFGDLFLTDIFEKMKDESKENIISTMSEITVTGIADFIARFGWKVEDIYICGGGARNRFIISRLAEIFPKKVISTTAELGYDPDYLEALLWAFMAYQFVRGNPINARYFTRATKPYIPGKMCLP